MPELITQVDTKLSNIITLFDKSTLKQSLRKAQTDTTDTTFKSLLNQASNSSANL